MRQIQRFSACAGFPAREDGTSISFHLGPGTLVYAGLVKEQAPDTYIDLRDIRWINEGSYDSLRLSRDNGIVLSGPAFSGVTPAQGVYHFAQTPSGLFVSKYEPRLESIADELKVESTFGEPLEFDRVGRTWILHSELGDRWVQRVRFVTPLYQ